MTPAGAFRRILITAAIPLTLAGCNPGATSAIESRVAAETKAPSPAATPSTPARTGYADVEGGRIAYQVHGNLNSGKTPLLVLHGSFMSADAMAPFVEGFAKSRPVIAIDARDHGRTGKLPGPVTYDLMADDGAAVLKSLNVPTADVMGYSLGGTTAIVMAVRHPDQVSKQIILSGASKRAGWYPEVAKAISKSTPEQFAGSPMEAEYKRLSPNPETFPVAVKEVTGLEAQNFDQSSDAVRAIKGKTMIIIGDADGVQLEHAVELFKLRGGGDRAAATKGILTEAPRARLAILPAASHVGMMSAADEIVALATLFLDDQPPPKPTGLFAGIDKPPGPDSH